MSKGDIYYTTDGHEVRVYKTEPGYFWGIHNNEVGCKMIKFYNTGQAVEYPEIRIEL